MLEKLAFHFEGALADKHRMNFYEAARFQYAAARLLVKLSQFRDAGGFKQKIFNSSNFDVMLASQSKGSFNINVEDSGVDASKEPFIDISLGDLLTYVSERVIEKINEDTFKKAGQAFSGAEDVQTAIDKSAKRVVYDAIPIEEIALESRDLVKRRVAEISRENSLLEKGDLTSKISLEKSRQLVAMSAPLISEMATALRRSADTLEVTSSNSEKSKQVLFLDQNMASEIETSIVDRNMTPLLCDIVQFNKDNGWGKVKIENGTVTVGFTIPYDVLPLIRQTLIDTMKKDQVYLQTYLVRDRAGKIIRLIVNNILPTPID